MSTKTTAVLTIAGTDPSGREGIQADLQTFAAHGCHGTSVVTAVTAKTAGGVNRCIMSPDVVQDQIASTLRDVHVHAIKTGTLFNSAIARTIASHLGAHFKSYGRIPLVCDSVYVADYGSVLSREDVTTLVSELFPLAQVITLRDVDAQYMLNMYGHESRMDTLDDILVATRQLLTFCPRAVLVKGDKATVSVRELLAVSPPVGATLDVRSDFPLGEDIEIFGLSYTPDIKDHTVDVLCRKEGDTIAFTLYPRRATDSRTMPGVDAALSAALACSLGNKLSVEEAVARAINFTTLGVETASHYGRGSGPSDLNHFHSLSRLIVAPRTPKSPYPLTSRFIQNTAQVWKQYVRHDFVVQLGKGTLDQRSFEHFIRQDYLYLKYYARAYALLASKSNDYTSINNAAKIILGISEEIYRDGAKSLDKPLASLTSRKKEMQTSFCGLWGTSIEELESTPESAPTTAYGAFLIDTGLRGDTSSLIMAVAACLLGYGEVGLWLKKEAEKPNSWVVWEGNPYREWMEGYAGERYQTDVVNGIALMEGLAEEDSPSQQRYDAWFSIWERTVNFEKAFWDMALNLS